VSDTRDDSRANDPTKMIVSNGLDIYVDRNENLARVGPSQPMTS